MLYPVFTDGNPYLCDANGNETRNLSHRVKEASYNTMDLPSLVTFTDGNSLQMRYTSDGRRVETLSKTWLTPLVVPADTLAPRDSTLEYAQEAPSAPLAASASPTVSTSSSNAGLSSGSPATGITGPAPYLPYRLHREWRIGDVVLEDSLISRIDIRNGSFHVERDSLGGASLACYRHVTDYLGSVRTVYRMGTSWGLTPVQHIAYMPSGAVLANSDGDVQQRMFCGKELQPLHGWKMYDSHARMQYNVLPRFSSTDPLCQKYYHLSPYTYCANDPVNMVDPEGSFIVIMDKMNRWKPYYYHLDGLFYDRENNPYSGENEFIITVAKQLNILCSKDTGRKLVSDIVNSEKGVEIAYRDKNYEMEYSNELIDSNIISGIGYNANSRSSGGTPYTALGHELSHSLDRIKGTIDNSFWFQCDEEIIPKAEIGATFIENKIRSEHGISLRYRYEVIRNDVIDGAFVLDKTKKSLYFNIQGHHRRHYRKVKQKKRYQF